MKQSRYNVVEPIARRSFIKGALASGVATGALVSGMSHASGQAAALNVSEQELENRKHEIVRRLRYREDAGYLVWWFKGQIMAQTGADLMPLFNLVHCAIGQLEPRQDGGFDLLTVEIPFRTDLKTGAMLTKYMNPLTHEEIEIPYAVLGPTEVRFSETNALQLPEKIGGSTVTYEQVSDNIYGVGDTVMYSHHARSKVETPGKDDRIITEYSTISGPMERALDRNVKMAPAVIQSSDVTGFARWLKTPAELGNQSLRAVGGKVDKVADIPNEWMSLVKQQDPEIYKDPFAALKRPQAVYKS